MKRAREAQFLLVDLYSQREAVRRHVRGWREASILSWMRKFGTVDEVPTFDDDGLYIFRSKWAGLKTSFYLTEERGLVFMVPGKAHSPQPS